MQKMKYYARLVNDDGIMFDCNYFNNIKDAKEWAKDRSETNIYNFSLYYIKNTGNIGDVKMHYYVKNNKIYTYK